MKKSTLILSLIFFVFISNAQYLQKGNDIDGTTAEDALGTSVSMNSDGSIVAVGATQGDMGGSDPGYVEVYEFVSGAWVQIGNRISSPDAEGVFGTSVSINGDGTIVAVGDPFQNSKGVVRVYKFDGTNWVQMGSDFIGDANYDEFGASLSFNETGDILAIGSKQSNNGTMNSGHVNVYQYSTGTWSMLGSTINGIASVERFGTSVNLNPIGNFIAIGAPQNDIMANDPYTGYAAVFEFSGGTWNQVGTNIAGDNNYDLFGWSVSINGDGSQIVVGAPNGKVSTTNPGYVKTFEFTAGSWTQTGTTIVGEADGDFFGVSVSMKADANIFAVGAPNNSGNGTYSGSTRLYQYTSNDWVQIGGDFDGEAADNLSGNSVSLSTDGSTMAIGAPFNSETFASAGHTRLYYLCNTNSTLDVTVCSQYTSPSGNYTWYAAGTYYDTIPNTQGCDSIITINLSMHEAFDEQICMVTFDTLTGKNMVIWEKTENENIERYIIWREGSTANVYDSIGGVSFADLNEFIDTVADPMSQPFNYKVTTVDSCGNHSSIDNCSAHKTIHLQASLGSPSGYQLQWTDYSGYSYNTFYIYGRETGVGNFQLVHQSAFGINTWTDGTTAPSMEYRISIEKASPCIPYSLNKLTSGPYSQSISNIDDYSANVGIDKDINNLGIYLYPNPNSGIFTVSGDNITKIEIVDMNGKVILTKENISEFNNISVDEKGIYFVRIINNETSIVKRVVVK